jgi:hypothetical protein
MSNEETPESQMSEESQVQEVAQDSDLLSPQLVRIADALESIAGSLEVIKTSQLNYPNTIVEQLSKFAMP